MGMYTELVLNCEIRNDTQKDVIDILLYLFHDRKHPLPSRLPDHPFFLCERWDCIGGSSSFYFVPFSLSVMRNGGSKDYYISTRSDLKNYDQEIQKFLHWVGPYIYGYGKKFLGYFRYEEDDEPTLIYKDNHSNEIALRTITLQTAITPFVLERIISMKNT